MLFNVYDCAFAEAAGFEMLSTFTLYVDDEEQPAATATIAAAESTRATDRGRIRFMARGWKTCPKK